MRGPDDAVLRLYADVDLRLEGVWEYAFAVEEWDFELAWLLIRLGYGKGYYDCFLEGGRGDLFRDHGLPFPRRRR